MDSQFIIAIISSLSLWGVIWWVVTFFLNQSKEFRFAQIEQREKRYKSTLLFMETYLDIEKVKWMQFHGISQVRDKDDVYDYLIAEYQQMILYAGKEVVASVNNFIKYPTKESFLKTIIAMRSDLWLKKWDLTIQEIKIPEKKKS